ncbi:MAG: SDR family oxidoreductase [Verrucomicrobiota bacterium]
MTPYHLLKDILVSDHRTWIVTGAAGFIGSNLVEQLLKLNQNVVGIDNFATGRHRNLNQVRSLVSLEQWARFQFVRKDITDPDIGRDFQRADYVLHQAALGSVPRSIAAPQKSHDTNVSGFLNVLNAAKEAGVRQMVYASSSSVYGDHPDLPKVEEKVGQVLSPYAATKKMNEIYADVFSKTYGFSPIGLRYFNVFGPRQDPNGPYAAVMPKWIDRILSRQDVSINGDGMTSRDFCYVENVVQANLLAATTENEEARNRVYNVAVGDRTTLNTLYQYLLFGLKKRDPSIPDSDPVYEDFRPGDVRHSLADISRAKELLGYSPSHTVEEGIEKALDWYVDDWGDSRIEPETVEENIDLVTTI